MVKRRRNQEIPQWLERPIWLLGTWLRVSPPKAGSFKGLFKNQGRMSKDADPEFRHSLTLFICNSSALVTQCVSTGSVCSNWTHLFEGLVSDQVLAAKWFVVGWWVQFGARTHMQEDVQLVIELRAQQQWDATS